MNRAVRITLYSIAGVLALGALLALWLLQTSGGARFALGQVPGLSVGEVSGTLAGPLTLERLEFDNPAAHLTAQRIEADIQLWPLLAGKVQLDRVVTRTLVLQLKPSATPAEPPAASPLVLPQIQVDALDVQDTTLLGLSDDPLVIQSLTGALTTGGEGLTLRQLVARLPQGELSADGHFDPAKLAGDIKARIVPTAGPAPLAEVGIALVSDGDKASLTLTLPDDAGVLQADIDQLRGARRFKAQLTTSGLDLTRLGVATGSPLPPAELTIVGDPNGAALDGSLTFAGQSWRFDGTKVGWSAERITLAPLSIAPAAGGAITAEGEIGLKDQNATLKLVAIDVPLGELIAQPEAGLHLVEANLDLAGSILDWQLTGTAHLTRDIDDLRFKLDVNGDSQQLSITTLELLASNGEYALGVLELAGTLGLEAPYPLALDARVEDFDPAALLPEWPGKITLAAKVSGAVQGAIDVAVQQLSGTLRGAALAGSGSVTVPAAGALPLGDLKLDWGGNHIELDAVADTPLALRFKLGEPKLIDPRLAGRLEGSARVPLDLSWIELDATGAALAFETDQLGALKLRARAGTAGDAPLDIDLLASDLVSGTQKVRSLRLKSSGTVRKHAVELDVDADQGIVTLAAAGGWDGSQWSGMLGRLGLKPGAAAPEQLRDRPLDLSAPTTLVVAAGRVELGDACLAQGSARVCLGGSYLAGADSKVNFRLQQLPLELLRPWSEPAGLVLEGQLDGDGNLTIDAAGKAGGVLTVRGSEVAVLLLGTETPKRFVLSRVEIQVAPNDAGLLAASADIDIEKLGSVVLRVGLDSGEAVLDVDFDSLAALDDLSPDLVKPRGALRGQLRRDAGVLSGEIALTGFSAELPAANIKLSNGEIRLSGAPESIRIDGQLSSGEGQLKVTGNFLPDAGLSGLTLDIDGERFLAADLPQARVLISPRLKVRGSKEELRISGEVGIPEGRIDLARFEPAVTPSADVVYEDAPPAEGKAGLPVRADVTVVLGDNVELRGFGLDGRIAGRLAMRERPDRPTTARGEISVAGTYKAYGQDLTIERGKLLFANSGLDNPGLDIRAARTIGNIKAGVQVRGSADYPELTTYSTPSMDQLNTISYLVLGRPASQAGGAAGGAAMQNAAQQLGGNLLAKSIGQKLGLEVGIESSAALGGAAAFSVGKYLSPKLFVGYGRSLYEELQLFIVRYKLRDRYEIEATSGREQKIGVNWRRER